MNAKKCNLNLSSYLRKSGLQKEIYEIPDEELRKIYAKIVELKNEFPYLLPAHLTSSNVSAESNIVLHLLLQLHKTILY